MSSKILVSGLMNIETTVFIDRFPIEYCPVRYLEFGVQSVIGGVGFNLAKAMTTLGDRVEVLSFTGEDAEADRITAGLEKIGVSTGGIQRELKSTPTSAILYDRDGRRQIFCDLKDIQQHMMRAECAQPLLENADAAALCNINFNRGLLQKAREMKKLIATDVHVLRDIEDDYNRDYMANADILFLSDEGLPCSHEAFIRKLYERYHNRVIVIGMGAKGALLLDSAGGSLTHVPAYPEAKVVNTVGAGDSLFASFLHYYVKGLSAEESLRRAVIFAGVKIGYNGASVGFSTEAEIEERLG